MSETITCEWCAEEIPAGVSRCPKCQGSISPTGRRIEGTPLAAPTAPAKPNAPAGWYDDPTMVNTRRYWDGEKWTDRRLEKGAAVATPAAVAVPVPAAADPAESAPVPPMSGKAGRVAGVAGIIFILLVIAGTIAGNSGSGDSTADPGSGSAPDTAGSKYQQTWPKPYKATTCDEWLNQMSPQQRFAAAADMLTGARSKDGGDGVPDDSLIHIFEGGLDNVCVEPTSKLTDMAVGLYLTERSTFRP